MKQTLLSILALAVLAACANNAPANAPTTAPSRPANARNGATIYLTGRDAAGHQISAATKPLRESCAACHGANGAGGVKFPDGAVSADLRHGALVVKQKPPYTLALVERAITKGLDNQGKPLDKVMPHWELSGADLRDVAQYVLSLK